MTSIVLATDGSPSAEKATAVALELARNTRAKLHVVSVWHGPLTSYATRELQSLPDGEHAAWARATRAAHEAVALARAEGVEAEAFVCEGKPVAVICETAATTKASLVVVGSRGWSALRELTFGSVSKGLLNRAPCPVLVARADHKAAVQPLPEKERAVL